jgi:hypothetical protein
MIESAIILAQETWVDFGFTPVFENAPLFGEVLQNSSRKDFEKRYNEVVDKYTELKDQLTFYSVAEEPISYIRKQCSKPIRAMLEKFITLINDYSDTDKGFNSLKNPNYNTATRLASYVPGVDKVGRGVTRTKYALDKKLGKPYGISEDDWKNEDPEKTSKKYNKMKNVTYHTIAYLEVIFLKMMRMYNIVDPDAETSLFNQCLQGRKGLILQSFARTGYAFSRTASIPAGTSKHIKAYTSNTLAMHDAVGKQTFKNTYFPEPKLSSVGNIDLFTTTLDDKSNKEKFEKIQKKLGKLQQKAEKGNESAASLGLTGLHAKIYNNAYKEVEKST